MNGDNDHDESDDDSKGCLSFRREGPDLRHTCKITLREASVIIVIATISTIIVIIIISGVVWSDGRHSNTHRGENTNQPCY